MGQLGKNIAEVNVVVVQNLASIGDQGVTPYIGAPLCYVQAGNYEPQAQEEVNRFLYTVMHEIEHQLDLSTRWKPTGSPVNPYARHDPGVFPKITYAGKKVEMLGLMYGAPYQPFIPAANEKLFTFWLRHEDWERASLTGVTKPLPWTYNPPLSP